MLGLDYISSLNTSDFGLAWITYYLSWLGFGSSTLVFEAWVNLGSFSIGVATPPNDSGAVPTTHLAILNYSILFFSTADNHLHFVNEKGRRVANEVTKYTLKVGLNLVDICFYCMISERRLQYCSTICSGCEYAIKIRLAKSSLSTKMRVAKFL